MFGGSAADNVVSTVFRSIRWADFANPAPALRTLRVDLANLVPGRRYKLQLLFGEQCCSQRIFDVLVEGALVANDFVTAEAQGGIPLTSAGSAVVHEFIAGDATLNIVLDGASVTAIQGLDRNPILNGLTLEEMSLSPLAAWRSLHGLPADGSQDYANPSKDGVANLLKYAFNMAPVAGDLLKSNVSTITPSGTAGLPLIQRNGAGQLVFTYRPQ